MFPDTTATIHTLDNGLKVILEENHSAPVISTQAWVETGSIHEHQWLGAGISHLLEHMVFKGTQNFSGEELSQTVQAAGGQWNAYTTFDRTVYYIDGPADSTALFLKAITEMVFKPTFPVDEFEKEKDVIRREIDMGLDDPDNRASRQLFATALANDGRSQPVIGHLELFNQLTHEDMVTYHRSRYTTENTFLSISGAFNTEDLLLKINQLVSDIPRTFTQSVQPTYEPTQLGKRTARSHFSIPASKLSLAWQTPGIEHPDAPILELLSSILGGGRSSRLYQNLREKQELCLHIGAWAWITKQPKGLFCINAEVTPEQRDTLEKAIHQEIETLIHSVTQEELEKVKRMCLVSQFKTLTTASGRASDLASNWHETRNLNFTKEYISTIENITLEDLKRVCSSYLTTTNTLTITSLDPQDTVKAPSSMTQKSTNRAIQSHTLSNGLELFICAEPRLPMVSIQSASLGGLTSESKDTAGINTLLSTLLTKGTHSRSGEAIATQLESLGATLSANAGNNTSTMAATCLSQDIDTVLEIYADTFANPLCSQSHLDFEKETQRTALLEQEEDPLSLAFRTMRSHLFNNEGYGVNKLGSQESLTQLTPETLKHHHAQLYRAHNTKIAIFGDVQPEALIESAEQTLSQIPTGAPFTPNQQTVQSGQEIALHLDKQQAVLTLGYAGASVHSEDIYALDLLHAWCSDMAGPLFTRIREDLGLAYYCSATQFHGHNTGLFAFYLGTSPEQLDLAQKELQNTIHAFSSSAMNNTTLDAVKASWLSNQALNNQSNNAMARLCAIDTALGFSPNHNQETIDKIQAVTPKDILHVAQKYLGTQSPTIVTVTPS